MESVLANDAFHVIASEPDGAPAPEWRITRRENDLFVAAHAQHFLREDQGPCRQLLGARSRRPRHLRCAAQLVDLHRGVAAASRDVVGGLGIVDRGEGYP